MNENIWVLMSGDAIAIATTLILAALGALFTERSGVLNLGIEGILLTAAISSFLAADADVKFSSVQTSTPFFSASSVFFAPTPEP